MSCICFSQILLVSHVLSKYSMPALVSDLGLHFCTAKSTHIFFSKKFQHICVSLDVNFNESLTNDVVSFEQLGPGFLGSDLLRGVQFDHFTNIL